MHSLLKSIAICLFAREVASLTVEVEKRDDNVTLAAPIVAKSSLTWEGVDGTWNTFEIRVGTLEKGTAGGVYRVLPATSWQETWVIYGAAAGICDTSVGVSSDCYDQRGGMFDSAKSSTWKQTYANDSQNQYSLGLNTNLGENGVGQYGFDTVGIGYTDGDGPTLSHQIVSEIVSNTFWFGLLGLGFQPTNFTNYANPEPSFADTLWTNGTISSMSWSYTAGAVYRSKNSIYGSLIFGGYDASRFTPNDVIFTMTGDTFRDLVVTIRSITSTTSTGNTTLMSTPEYAFIDSTVPELWLPEVVCQEFEKAFGLKLDNDTGTYLVDNSTHDKLLALNPNITITLGNQKAGGDTIDIVLPYAAFDLTVKPPILPNRTSLYFPLMQQSDPGQYVLGRTFLQEAYVTTHYNSRTFNVSQTVFDDGAPAHVIAIPATLPTSTSTSGGGGNGTNSNPTSKKKLKGGAIAGIVIGILAFIAVVGSVLACFLSGLLCFRNRKRDSRPSTPIVEIDPGRRIEPKPVGPAAYESQASAFTSEVDGTDAKVEIQGNPIMHPQELEAEVPIPAGTRESEPVNGPSDGSRETGVSSLSPIREQKTPMAELGAAERGLGAGAGQRESVLVSPNSPTIPHNSMMGRAMRGEDAGGRESPSPIISEATWTPTSPVQRRGTNGSRFEERLDD